MEQLTWATLVGAAAVDSINPCTLAILLILLTTLISTGRKGKVIWAGLAFTSAIYISYFLMGLGIYSAIEYTGISRIFYYLVIVIAFIVGVLSIRDYFDYKPGFWAVEIPLSWRGKVQKIIRGVTSIPGAAVIGFLCSLFLLPCSSGPYLVILGLLANTSTRLEAIPLLLIYNLIFVLPMIIITLAVNFGMASVEELSKWRNENIKVIHLVSGIIMVLIAFLLILALYMGWIS